MNFKISLLVGFCVLFTCSACGDMLRSLRQESREVDEEAERDRDSSENAAGNAQARSLPRNLHGLSANNTSEYEPPAARSYGRKLAGHAAAAADSAEDAAGGEYHRATRDDFVDKVARENSLWDGQGQSNYLFANNRRREAGDMLTADVEKELRREIQYQLWLSLPPEQRKTKRSPAGAAGDAITNTAAGNAKDVAGNPVAKAGEKPQETKAKDAAEEAAKANMAPAGKDDDSIKMEVVENMGNGMLRVLGQKRVIYKGVSRVVEVAALLHSKDVDDGNHAKSSSFLDMKAQVIQ